MVSVCNAYVKVKSDHTTCDKLLGHDGNHLGTLRDGSSWSWVSDEGYLRSGQTITGG